MRPGYHRELSLGFLLVALCSSHYAPIEAALSTSEQRLDIVPMFGYLDLMHNDTKKVTGPELADCPEDGGKWALYCEHYDATGELVGCGIVQDTNKKRLAPWRKESFTWCCYCQEEAK